MVIAVSAAGMARKHHFWSRFRRLATACFAINLFPAAFAADVVSVWGGARSTVILKSDGTVWTWGANFNGKLGLGETNDQRSLTPVEVHGPGNVSYINSVAAVMGGEIHNVALKADGTVWCWGWNAFGQLGNGTTNDSWVPVQAGLTATPPLANVVKLGGRPYFTLAEKADGTIWAWGMNQFGQMGNGTVTPFGSPPNSVPVLVSNSQPGGPINGAAQITCGYQFGAALTTNGTVWVWGTGTHGEQGTGPTTSNYLPVQVPGLTNITQISAGWFHILARKADGTAWAWGDNSHGELGDGTTNNGFSPVRVVNVSNIVAVSGGDSHSSALAADGTIWKFGKNDVGELGIGSANTNANPFPTKIPTDKFGNVFSNIVMMSARDYHNIALKADGSVWMWGANDQGQCGDGTQNDAWRPVPVVGLGARAPLPLNIAAGGPGFANLSWSCSTGQFFNLEFSTNLTQGFITLQSNLLATPPTTVLSVPLTNPVSFYRLRF